MKKLGFIAAWRKAGRRAAQTNRSSKDIMIDIVHLIGKTDLANQVVIAEAKCNLLPPATSYDARPEREKRICERALRLYDKARKEVDRLYELNFSK